LAKGRKVTGGDGHRPLHRPEHDRGRTGRGENTVSFDQCIIAAGSEPVTLPFIPHDDPRVIDSTGALELADPRTDAGAGRRHHRVGDGLRL
jgi:dihydrolipoamide dehydrogenase